MRQLVLYVICYFLTPLFVKSQTVVSINIDAVINPATAEYIHRGIEKAKKEKATCLIIHLNTPGGLLKSTRIIVGDIMESTVPVIVYVSPAGAQAGSAGVFITLAAHIAVMAPGTNIGAAHPVDMQGNKDSIMAEKLTNDAAAFIRTIAEKRKRNTEWAELAVRKSVSITSTEALDKKVIDLVAKNDHELLQRIDGRKVEVNEGSVILQTKTARVQTYDMNFAEKILSIIGDPNVAYILLILGFYGLLFELYNPGAILPGIIGVISLILAFYALHTLPLNYAGLALIAFAIILFLLEIKIVSHGLLAISGVISMLLGSLMLIREDTGEVGKISLSVILTMVSASALFFLFVIGLGLKAQRAKPVTGVEALIGETGSSLEMLDPVGTVFVHGEIWKAESTAGIINKGEKVRVIKRQNFKLFVEVVQKDT
ncbi:NfeD family protein [Solitalea canadensis]|uniref:Membrane-bound serine protease (ClpP class) n=1 Tax=Solitalea canadensis (strain ATCC 29591 / DSM 3403 / JCM 21819 / LMG 8368 / NBRC 15130 / NCIMB 12057 / USAM 9D) TaxID=929556 RepID=H8KPJ6_SOLCM|nr:nodulation protein NfeD [Solitalea canadensis]AFD05894.1 membrane-bound serine protease (ClpP class) [Solitalea canadensis DSM 3403]